MTKKFLGQLFRVAALVGSVAAAMVIILYSAFYGKALDAEKVIYINKATQYSEIVEQLRPSLRSKLHQQAFDFYAKRLNLEGRFRTGRYLFGEGESVIRAVRRLVLGTPCTQTAPHPCFCRLQVLLFRISPLPPQAVLLQTKQGM